MAARWRFVLITHNTPAPAFGQRERQPL